MTGPKRLGRTTRVVVILTTEYQFEIDFAFFVAVFHYVNCANKLRVLIARNE